MMSANMFLDLSQLLALLVVVTLLVKPLGGYMAKVYQEERSLLPQFNIVRYSFSAPQF
jgi:K+-transporting ATPase A subunit